MFVDSRDAFAAMDGWEYRLWDEEAVGGLIRERYPALFDVYRGLRYPIQRVDVAKYAIADAHGGVVCDLDVLPRCHLDDIALSPCTFDRCSRSNVIANDFLYIETGLAGIFEDFAANLARVEAIPVYTHWKMHHAFQTTGPSFFTRYLKHASLARNAQRLSARSFLDPRQRHREVALPAGDCAPPRLVAAGSRRRNWRPAPGGARNGGFSRCARAVANWRRAPPSRQRMATALVSGVQTGVHTLWFRRRGHPVRVSPSSGASHCNGLLVVIF